MMLLFHLCVLLGASFAVELSATPKDSLYVVHQRRREHSGWQRELVPDPQTKIPLRIGLKQRNLGKGEKWLLDVSDPKSNNYGKHWSVGQVAKAFSPTAESFERVETWLKGSGITKFKKTLGWIKFNSTIREVEELTRSKYFWFKDRHSGLYHLACDEYSVPGHLGSDIDIIVPTVDPSKPRKHRGRYRRLQEPKRQSERSEPLNGEPSSHALPSAPIESAQPAPTPHLTVQDSIDAAIQTCWDSQNNHGAASPDCIRLLYGYMPNFSSNPANSIAIPEYITSDTGHPVDQSYTPHDLDLFFNAYGPRMTGQRPIFQPVGGGYLATPHDPNQDPGESDLDLEIAISIVYPQKVTLLQSDGSYNDMLDTIDGSYCTYMGGGQPGYDSNNPDCGIYALPSVISTSYGAGERYYSHDYMARQCSEYMKLGLLGTSVLYSSGDDGVAENGGSCLPNNVFSPSFPATCPWITSVGATQLNEPIGDVLSESATTEFPSGGGFSRFFAIPDYQASAVQGFLAVEGNRYPSTQYNASGRGFPDVSALGQDILIGAYGGLYYFGGTSASSPLIASLLTLINDQLLDAGKPTVGFINPAVYQNPQLFTDITVGNNPGCNTNGWPAREGWDPVTGVGTPIFPKMLEFFMTLGD